ncbi:MAG: hypothetical protein KKF24_05945 [Gammaproteobacteria bacterium]|nr:hypothetical protein [Gammaproteobacteria bacterium]MBU1832220.1 hypothetical protein [Gammaproteobacteria bacterium]
MTEPTDNKTRTQIDGSSDHPIIDPTEKCGHWNDFFDMNKQHQVGGDFARGDQLPAPDRNVDWDEVFGTKNNFDDSAC